MKKLVILSLMLLYVFASPAAFADYQKGLAAYENRDYAAAIKWYTLAADQGSAEAQFYLGLMHYQGHGTPQNYKSAVDFFTASAKKGLVDAQFNLGVLYDSGNGVALNHKTAFQWYLRAAKQGFAGAQTALGNMYRAGVGVPRDHKIAFKWYSLAAKQGSADAQAGLGYMYRAGAGVTEDLERALKWFTRAAKGGHKNAREMVRKLRVSIARLKSTRAAKSRGEMSDEGLFFSLKGSPNPQSERASDIVSLATAWALFCGFDHTASQLQGKAHKLITRALNEKAKRTLQVRLDKKVKRDHHSLRLNGRLQSCKELQYYEKWQKLATRYMEVDWGFVIDPSFDLGAKLPAGIERLRKY